VVVDDHGGAGQGGQLAEGEAQGAVDQAGDEVVEGLALDGGDDRVLDRHRVVAARQGRPRGLDVRRGEGPRVALAGVDEDAQRLGVGGGAPARTGGRRAHVGAGLLAGARGLPEDGLAAAGPGEDDLRPLLAGPVGDDVDGRPAARARDERDHVDEVRAVGPVVQRHRVAVDGGGPRPAVPGPVHQPLTQRHPDQVRQAAVGVRVAGHEELHENHPGPAGALPGQGGRSDVVAGAATT
jgi:hypothetical protein